MKLLPSPSWTHMGWSQTSLSFLVPVKQKTQTQKPLSNKTILNLKEKAIKVLWVHWEHEELLQNLSTNTDSSLFSQQAVYTTKPNQLKSISIKQKETNTWSTSSSINYPNTLQYIDHIIYTPTFNSYNFRYQQKKIKHQALLIYWWYLR